MIANILAYSSKKFSSVKSMFGSKISRFSRSPSALVARSRTRVQNSSEELSFIERGVSVAFSEELIPGTELVPSLGALGPGPKIVAFPVDCFAGNKFPIKEPISAESLVEVFPKAYIAQLNPGCRFCWHLGHS